MPRQDLEALVVDDVSVMRRVVQNLLRRAGILVSRQACDGKTALEQMQLRRPDLVISDCNMEGMSGPQLVVAMRQDPELKDIPVILMTTPGEELQLANVLGCGPTDLLLKPLDLAKLQEKIEAMTHKP